VADWQALARRAARREGVDPNIFVRLVGAESTGNPRALSPAGAIGYTQLMPDTARGLGVNPRDPWQNLVGGARYLKQQLHTFGNYDDALRAYNAGPAAVRQSHGYAETNAYVQKILRGANPAASTRAPRTGGAGPAPASSAPGGLGGLTSDPGSSGDVSALLSLLTQKRQAPASMGVQAPAFSARPAMPAGYQAPVSGGGPEPRQDINQLLELVRTQGGAGTTGGAAGGQTAPAMTGGKATRTLGTPVTGRGGTGTFDGKTVAGWIEPALKYARAHGWKGTVASGLRSTREQAQLYADFKAGRRAGPVAPPGSSRHEGANYPYGAVDVSDAARLNAILRNSPYRKRLQWAGARDPVHFSHQFGGTY
jgi:hypothetical protein